MLDKLFERYSKAREAYLLACSYYEDAALEAMQAKEEYDSLQFQKEVYLEDFQMACAALGVALINEATKESN